MLKKFLSTLCSMILLLSFSTAAFAASDTENPTNSDLQQRSQSVDANDPAKLKEALADGLTIDETHPTATHTFEDGSYIQLSANIDQSSSKASFATAASTSWATVSLKAYSAVTGDNLLLWTYTMDQEYRSNGSSITWYNSVPSTGFYVPSWSLWNLGSEVVGVNKSPDDPRGIRATSSIKTSFGIWEANPQHPNGKLILNIFENGRYSSSAYFT